MDVQIEGGSGEQKSYAVAGAILQCSCGESRCVAKMPRSHGVFTKTKAQLNIMDFVPIANVGPFGLCSSMTNPVVAAATAKNGGGLQKMPCVPVITMPWIGGKEDTLIENFPALLNTCTNMCTWAGKITIEDDGQER